MFLQSVLPIYTSVNTLECGSVSPAVLLRLWPRVGKIIIL